MPPPVSSRRGTSRRQGGPARGLPNPSTPPPPSPTNRSQSRSMSESSACVRAAAVGVGAAHRATEEDHPRHATGMRRGPRQRREAGVVEAQQADTTVGRHLSMTASMSLSASSKDRSAISRCELPGATTVELHDPQRAARRSKTSRIRGRRHSAAKSLNGTGGSITQPPAVTRAGSGDAHAVHGGGARRWAAVRSSSPILPARWRLTADAGYSPWVDASVRALRMASTSSGDQPAPKAR